jgi:phosphotransferase system HPr (HPr) family protein
MVRDTVTVGIADGLHARPAAEFVRIAQSAGHTVLVSKPGTTAGRGDSILTIMALGAKRGDRIVIEVTGPDEKTLLQSLKTVVSG